jgi:hypothetical protein
MRPRPLEVVCAILAAVTVWMSARGASQTIVVLVAIVAGFVAAGCAVDALAKPDGRSRVGTWSAWLGTSFIVIAPTGLTHWPLRVSYLLSRGAFEDTARRVGAGEQLEMPQLIGLFTIRKAEISDRGPGGKVACLWTDLEPSGFTGFVQWPGGGHPPFNTWSELPLGGWQFISED